MVIVFFFATASARPWRCSGRPPLRCEEIHAAAPPLDYKRPPPPEKTLGLLHFASFLFFFSPNQPNPSSGLRQPPPIPAIFYSGEQLRRTASLPSSSPSSSSCWEAAKPRETSISSARVRRRRAPFRRAATSPRLLVSSPSSRSLPRFSPRSYSSLPSPGCFGHRGPSPAAAPWLTGATPVTKSGRRRLRLVPLDLL